VLSFFSFTGGSPTVGNTCTPQTAGFGKALFTSQVQRLEKPVGFFNTDSGNVVVLGQNSTTQNRGQAR